MIWKAIGNSVTGTSHIATGKPCEDAVKYRVIEAEDGSQVLICCASDGAGSAEFGGLASEYVTTSVIEQLALKIVQAEVVTEATVFELAESLFDGLEKQAAEKSVDLQEFSCTLLGCCISAERAVFFQVGDGAIVRNDGSGFYTPVWWPQNGEYLNSTSFIIDDRSFSQLKMLVLEETVDEIALFTDGLQMLALNMEGCNVHQPFFTGLFKYLRMADDPEKIAVLDRKLAEYLDSTMINERTDDDKTLFLATRQEG